MTLPGATNSEPSHDHYYFAFWGGRAMAMLVLALLAWSSMVSDRDTAKRRLDSFTPQVHAAAYDSAYARMKSDSEATDGFLAVVAVIIASVALLYEALAAAFTWVLARLNGVPPRRDSSRGLTSA